MARDLNVDQIKKLWVLDQVIREGSLKKAAVRIKVSPSAVSQTLTSLEQAFGKKLLLRERGVVIATQDAINILEIVRPAFEAFDRLRDLNGPAVPKITWMNFGTYESIAIDVLPSLLHTLKQKLPKLRLGLRISRTANLLSMVRKGELCSALITETDNLDRFYVREVGRDRMGLYVSRYHPIAKRGWNAISEYGLGSLSPGKDGLPRYFSKFLKARDIGNATILSDSFEVLRSAATAGAIAAVLPNRVANRHADLIEISRSTTSSKEKSEQGEHRILIVSQNCDREEADFLAEESHRILDLRKRVLDR